MASRVDELVLRWTGRAGRKLAKEVLARLRDGRSLTSLGHADRARLAARARRAFPGPRRRRLAAQPARREGRRGALLSPRPAGRRSAGRQWCGPGPGRTLG